MIQKGNFAWYGNSLVTVLNTNGNNVFYKIISGKGMGNRGNTYASELKSLKPAEELALRNKRRITKMNQRQDPHNFPQEGCCPECGAQNFVIGVPCPNCEYVQNECLTFKEWIIYKKS